MIGIKYNGEWFDLLPSTRIQLALKSPLFAENNVIPGSFSLPFELPFGEASPKNTQMLSHIDVVENPVRVRKVQVQLHYDNNLFKPGYLAIGKVNAQGNRVSTNFDFGLSILADDFKTKKITEIANDSVTMSSAPFVKSVILIARTNIHSAPFKIEINGREFSGNNNAAIAAAINADANEPRAKATYVNTPFNGDAPDYISLEPYTGATNIETPLTIKYIDDIPSTLKWSINADDLHANYTTPIINWLNTNFNTATPLDNRMRFPMYKNEGLYEDEKVKWFKSVDYNWMNPCNFGNYLGNLAANEGFRPSNFGSLAPYIRLAWVMDRIESYFGIEFEGDFLTDPDYDAALFFHSHSLDIRIPFITGTDEARDWIAFKRTFNTNEFLPEITVPELLKSIGACFNLAVYYNEATGSIRLQKRDPILSERSYIPKTRYSPLKDSDDIGLNGITFRRNKDTDDLRAIDDQYVSGESEQDIVFALGSTPGEATVYYGSSSLYPYTVPVVKRKSSTKIPLSFFFYEYRAGGASGNKPLVNTHLQDCNFTLAGAEGLIEKRHALYLRFLLTRKELSYTEYMALGEVLALDWEKKVMLDRVKYLYKDITLTLSMQGIEPAEVTLYTTP